VVARAVVVQARAWLSSELADAMAEHGVEAIRADDGPDLLRLVAVYEPDVVVVDLTLPPLDGWCALAELGHRRLGGRPEIVVRVADHRQAERALRLGADAWAADDAQVVAAAGRLVTAIAA
jgi:DNA-binding response OmpR family regulator